MREIYFLIMHFLSHGPFKRTVGELCNELLEHQLLPRRYHAWYSRGGIHSGEENDDGVSLPVGYLKLLERYITLFALSCGNGVPHSVFICD
jgi:PH-interacting protein